MALVDKLFISGVWVESAIRYANTTGTPIVSAEESGSGELLSDDYTLEFSAVMAGTATVTVVSASPNNPYRKVVTGVPVDDVTEVENVIPGVKLIFNNTTANGDDALVHIGSYEGTFDAFGVDAGDPSDGVKHRVENTGTGAVSDAKARLLTQAVLVKKTGKVFNWIKPFAEDAAEKVEGGGSNRIMPYQLKVVGTSGAGAGKICNLQLNTGTIGVPVWTTFPADSILDLSTGDLVSGTGLKSIDTYEYRIVDGGDLDSLQFALSADRVNNDIANVLIFPSRFTQIAEDIAGVEGTYGTSDVDLTQTGESAGVIQPGEVADYWVRTLVPLNANAESNPYPAMVALEASETGSAGWEE